ncbi:MAG: sulfotransferase domain-containing protein [Saprospiraceae bacterium]
MQPIIIAGFGRSGTTWVSDIVSKTMGGLILFEPDHPCVNNNSENWIYKAHLHQNVIDFEWERFFLKKNKNQWLLRNHLISNENQSDEILNSIWNNSQIIGFKCIRWNHSLDTLSILSGNKLIYIIRHPLAVVASLLRRPNFFLEFGWDTHWQLFKKRNPLKEINLEQYDHSQKSIKYVAMWAISNIKALTDLHTKKIPFWQYEKLYHTPYEEAKRMLSFLGVKDVNIHPSYLFYPSMSTLKTFHTDEEGWPSRKHHDMNVFWKEILDDPTIDELLYTVDNLVSHFPKIKQIFHRLNYLKA